MEMGKRILIVDDSSMMRKMVGEALEAHGHHIVGYAKNGDEAIGLYKSLNPDLVTMDITMRGMDGLTAAKEILKHDGKAQIVFLSNLIDNKCREEAMLLGAKDFINKNETAKILQCIDHL
jgi:two-component system chemotaxis response regulator CheY